MIGSGDRDGVDVLVFQELTKVDVGLGLGNAEFFDVGEALVEDVFVDIAQGDDLRVGDFGEPVNVVDATAAGAADGDADFVVGAENFAAEGEAGRGDGCGFACGFEEFTAFDGHRGHP